MEYTRTLARVLTGPSGGRLVAAHAPATAPGDSRTHSDIEGLVNLLPGDLNACESRYYFGRNSSALGLSMPGAASCSAKNDAQYAPGLSY